MATAPVQLLVLGFDHPDFSGQIKAELRRLREGGVVRLLDAIVIQTDSAGDVTLLEGHNLPPGEAEGHIAALIGLAEIETEVLTAADPALGYGSWTIDDLLPPDTAAALALIEHRWASGLGAAIAEANGTLLGDAWIHRDDLALATAHTNDNHSTNEETGPSHG